MFNRLPNMDFKTINGIELNMSYMKSQNHSCAVRAFRALSDKLNLTA